MFIHSSPALRPDHDYEKFILHALNTYTLGELVAPKWELGKATKWKPMNVGNLSRPLGPDDDGPSPFVDVKGDNARSIGMYKVHGTTVEAVVGGVFHEFVRVSSGICTIPLLTRSRATIGWSCRASSLPYPPSPSLMYRGQHARSPRRVSRTRSGSLREDGWAHGAAVAVRGRRVGF